MAIDHGLGGRNNQKSKEKRARKTEKQKKVALKALTGGKKRAVVFNEDARVEFLTGFHKRKQERRKFGLTMQILKDKRKHKQVRSDSRKMNEQLTGNIATSSSSSSCSGAVSNNVDDVDDDDENEDDEEEDDNQNQGAKSKKNKGKPMPLKEDKVFNDEHTQSMFGGCVSISISEIEL